MEEDEKIKENEVIIYGRSLGTGPASYLASQKPKIWGLILECPYLSIWKIRKLYKYFLLDIFKSEDYLLETDKELKILMIHGTHDQVIPYWNS